VQLQLGDQVGLLEGPVGAGLVADLPVVDDVAGLAFLVVPDDRRALGDRLPRVDDDRQRLVVDVDASHASLAMYGSSAMTQATSWPWNRTLSVASTAWVS
jgi:hypothetical protein